MIHSQMSKVTSRIFCVAQIKCTKSHTFKKLSVFDSGIVSFPRLPFDFVNLSLRDEDLEVDGIFDSSPIVCNIFPLLSASGQNKHLNLETVLM